MFMDFGCEGETVEFIDDMSGVDSAVRSMTAMLNRFNRARIVFGVDSEGEIIGNRFSEKDAELFVSKVKERSNRMPEIEHEIGPGGTYLIIRARGYETPYAYGGWFYGRKCRPTDTGFEWTETLTCGMKRH